MNGWLNWYNKSRQARPFIWVGWIRKLKDVLELGWIEISANSLKDTALAKKLHHLHRNKFKGTISCHCLSRKHGACYGRFVVTSWMSATASCDAVTFMYKSKVPFEHPNGRLRFSKWLDKKSDAIMQIPNLKPFKLSLWPPCVFGCTTRPPEWPDANSEKKKVRKGAGQRHYIRDEDQQPRLYSRCATGRLLAEA